MKPDRAWRSHPPLSSEASSTLAVDRGEAGVIKMCSGKPVHLVLHVTLGTSRSLSIKQELGQPKAVTFYYLPIRKMSPSKLCLLVPNEMSFQVGLER